MNLFGIDSMYRPTNQCFLLSYLNSGNAEEVWRKDDAYNWSSSSTVSSCVLESCHVIAHRTFLFMSLAVLLILLTTLSTTEEMARSHHEIWLITEKDKYRGRRFTGDQEQCSWIGYWRWRKAIELKMFAQDRSRWSQWRWKPAMSAEYCIEWERETDQQ